MLSLIFFTDNLTSCISNPSKIGTSLKALGFSIRTPGRVRPCRNNLRLAAGKLRLAWRDPELTVEFPKTFKFVQ